MTTPLHRDDALRALFLAAMADRPDDLNAIEREAVQAVFIERRPTRDAARTLAVPVGTLAHRLDRARRWARAWEATRRAA